MTDLERKKIMELRVKAWGYRKIATATNRNRDSVRNFCKRNGLDGFSPMVALNFNENNNIKILCKNCSKSIKNKGFGRKKTFCSDKCRKQWHYKKVKKDVD